MLVKNKHETCFVLTTGGIDFYNLNISLSRLVVIELFPNLHSWILEAQVFGMENLCNPLRPQFGP